MTKIVLGRYQIERLIGKGGIGEVYLGHPINRPDDNVAIKLVSSSRFDGIAKATLENELDALLRLRHPNLLAVFDFGIIPDPTPVLCLVTEFIEGQDLATFLLGEKSLEVFLTLITQLFQGLEFMHLQGVLHLDIKPANCLVRDNASNPLLKIIDLGAARPTQMKQSPEVLIGTRSYMAPEALAGGFSDQRSDLYSAGVMLRNLLDQAPAFPNSIAAKLTALTDKLTQPLPYRRFQTASEVLAFLCRELGAKLEGSEKSILIGQTYSNQSFLPDDLQKKLQNWASDLTKDLTKNPIGKRFLSISGETGVGKTRLVAQLHQSLHNLNMLWIEPDRQRGERLHFIPGVVDPESVDGRNQVDSTLRHLTTAAQTQFVVVVVDAVEALDQNEIELVRLLANVASNNPEIKLALVISHVQPWKEVLASLKIRMDPSQFTLLELRPLSSAEELRAWLEFLHPQTQVSVDFAKPLWKFSRGFPGVALDLVRKYILTDDGVPLLPWNPQRLSRLIGQENKTFWLTKLNDLDLSSRSALEIMALCEMPIPVTLLQRILISLKAGSGFWESDTATTLCSYQWRKGTRFIYFRHSAGVEDIVAKIPSGRRQRETDAALKAVMRFKDNLSSEEQYLLRLRLLLYASNSTELAKAAETYLDNFTSEFNRATGIALLTRAQDKISDQASFRRIGIGLVRMVLHINEITEAQKILKPLLKRYPKDPDVLELNLEILRRTGQTTKIKEVTQVLRASNAPEIQKLTAAVAELEAEILGGNYLTSKDELELFIQNPNLKKMPTLLLRGLLAASLAAFYIEDWDLALGFLERAKRTINTTRGTISEEITILYRTGIVFLRLRRFQEAQKQFEEARQLEIRFGDLTRQTVTTINLGAALQGQDLFEAALFEFTNAASLAQKIGESSNQALALMNLSNLQNFLGRSVEAEKNILEAITILQRNQLDTLSFTARLFAGEVFLAANKLKEAKRFVIEAAVSLRRQAGRAPRKQALVYLQLCSTHFALAQTTGRGLKKVKFFAQLALKRALENRSPDNRVVTQAKFWLAKTSYELGDLAGAKSSANLIVESLAQSSRFPDLILLAKALTLRGQIEKNLRETVFSETRFFLKNVWARILVLVPENFRLEFENSLENRAIRELVDSDLKGESAKNNTAFLSQPRPDDKLLQRFLSFLEQLHQIDSAPALYECMLEVMLELTQSPRGDLLVLENGKIETKALRAMTQAKGVMSRKIVERVFQTGEAVVSENLLADRRYLDFSTVIEKELGSVIAIPLFSRAAVLGVIYLEEPKDCRPEVIHFLKAYGNQAALVMAGRTRFDQLSEANRRLSDTVQQQRNLLNSQSSVIGRFKPHGMLTQNEAMLGVLRQVQRLASVNTTILIYGESGTGKELVAQSLHNLSSRKERPFIAVNCGTFTEGLLESTLFGHEEGSFTGATGRRIGLFESADGGTLLLDEIGELEPTLQAKLLRVLQTGCFRRVGGEKDIQVDVRVLAATHRQLQSLVRQGRFREDLYYRLAVVELSLPPLRARPEDIIPLAEDFIKESNQPRTKISQAAIDQLVSYHWPGNIRELKNAIERALIFCRGIIEPAHLDLRPLERSDENSTASISIEQWLESQVSKKTSFKQLMTDFEKLALTWFLRGRRSLKKDLAKELKLPRRTLFHKLNVLGLEEE